MDIATTIDFALFSLRYDKYIEVAKCEYDGKRERK